MHEFSLMADLMKKIERIAREERVPRILGVRVKLGALAHISADHFREHFEHAARGTVADGAELNINVSRDTKDPQAQDIILEDVRVERT